jgi:prepilin-type N-terminal cleavage/methylation domain-containing protein
MNRGKGFTLTELAVALVIVGLLLASALMPLTAQIDVRNFADTRRGMDGVKEAIIGFALANGRLPCPADGSVRSDASTAGTEQVTVNVCTTAFGVVPWATLGTPETDAW